MVGGCVRRGSFAAIAMSSARNGLNIVAPRTISATADPCPRRILTAIEATPIFISGKALVVAGDWQQLISRHCLDQHFRNLKGGEGQSED